MHEEIKDICTPKTLLTIFLGQNYYFLVEHNKKRPGS